MSHRFETNIVIDHEGKHGSEPLSTNNKKGAGLVSVSSFLGPGKSAWFSVTQKVSPFRRRKTVERKPYFHEELR